MKVKELIDELNKMPQDSVVIFDVSFGNEIKFISINNVTKGFNEFDGAVILDDYIEEDY